jgi:hypothetical protein
MFTPLIQYTGNAWTLAEPAKGAKPGEKAGGQNVLNIVEAGGCLEQDPTGNWTVTNGSDPVISKTQSTTSAAVEAAEGKPLGDRHYKLVGVSFFQPSAHKGQKVAVKGVLTTSANESRLNITSLQKVAATCGN